MGHLSKFRKFTLLFPLSAMIVMIVSGCGKYDLLSIKDALAKVRKPGIGVTPTH